MSSKAARQRFITLIRRPESQIDLAEAALCIAWEDQGAGDPEATLRELDALADAARPCLNGLRSDRERVDALNHFLFVEQGFKGNTDDYSNPANSYLDRVVALRTGLPITLSVVYIELGKRLALPITGLALPGHFLTRYVSDEGDLYIDPFNQGRLWSRLECERQIVAAYGAASPEVIEQVMEPPSPKAILARMLRNLKNTYIEMGAAERAIAAIDRIMLLEPGNPQELRDRGVLWARLGQFHLALADLDAYAQAMPQAPDILMLRLQARALADHVVRNN